MQIIIFIIRCSLYNFRSVIIPIFILFFYIDLPYSYLLAAFLFLYAAITDYIDGFLARKYSLVSPFGAFLDPVADKLVVVITLLMLVTQYNGLLFMIPVVIIVSREIIVSSLREWMALSGNHNIVSVSFIAKLKTSVQMIAIFILLLSLGGFKYNQVFFYGGLIFLYISALLTIVSMWLYLKSSWPYLWRNNKSKLKSLS